MKQLKQGEALERLLVGDWGWPRPVMVEYRREHLVKSDDWRYEREVILTPTGLAKMQRHFGLAETVNVPAIVEGCVVRWDWKNSRMVEVKGDDGQNYRVRVNNALKWRPDRKGKFMRIKFLKDGDQWRQVGRSPRYPGIW